MSEMFPEAVPEEVQAAIDLLENSGYQVSPASSEDSVESLWGLEFESTIPENWTPLEALILVKCMSMVDDGYQSSRLMWTSTANLPTWEASGMLTYAQHVIKRNWDLTAAIEESEDEEE